MQTLGNKRERRQKGHGKPAREVAGKHPLNGPARRVEIPRLLRITRYAFAFALGCAFAFACRGSLFGPWNQGF